MIKTRNSFLVFHSTLSLKFSHFIWKDIQYEKIHINNINILQNIMSIYTYLQLTRKFKLLTFLGKQYLPPSRKSLLLMIIYLLNLYEWPVIEGKIFKSYNWFGHDTNPIFEFLDGYFGSINTFTAFRNWPKVTIIIF